MPDVTSVGILIYEIRLVDDFTSLFHRFLYVSHEQIRTREEKDGNYVEILTNELATSYKNRLV